MARRSKADMEALEELRVAFPKCHVEIERSIVDTDDYQAVAHSRTVDGAGLWGPVAPTAADAVARLVAARESFEAAS